MFTTKLNELLALYGIAKLNSATKYPSILTYHDIGDRGSLKEELTEGKGFVSDVPYYITEKVDGENARIFLTGDDYFIGSREEWLYAAGDRVVNSKNGMIQTLIPVAERLLKQGANSGLVYPMVLYVEVYGGELPARKQYTDDTKVYGVRLFDASFFDSSVYKVLEQPLLQVSSWRQHGGQCFYTVSQLKQIAASFDLEIVPYILKVKGCELPLERIATLKWLQQFAVTKVGLSVNGKAEGVVIRSESRAFIRKLRFEDYERTARREQWEGWF